MQVDMYYYECWICGVPFGLSGGFVYAATASHTTFFCPHGCKLAFGKSAADKLREEKETSERRLQAQLNEANHRALVAEKAAKKAMADKRKVERRIAHGVCPCCNQTFADLSNHMMTQHKDFRLPQGKETKAIEGPMQ